MRDLQDLIRNCNGWTHCKVQRKFISKEPYFHHFMIKSINDSDMTVVHYASAISFGGNTMGKFVTQRIALVRSTPNKPCDLLDFDKGVYIVTTDAVRRDPREAEQRLTERMNESAYDTRFNNCEHIINDILYTTQLSNQADNFRCCSQIIAYCANDIKILFVLYTYLLLVGYPTIKDWRHNVEFQLLGGAILIDFANISNDTFDVPDMHDSLMDQVDKVKRGLEEIKDKMKHNHTFNEHVMENITALLTNPLVSEIAYPMTTRAEEDIFLKCIGIDCLLDLALSLYFFALGEACLTRYIPESKLIIRHKVRFCSSPCKLLLQGLIYVILILTNLRNIVNREYFFPIYIAFSNISRFCFTVLFGWLFDKPNNRVAKPSNHEDRRLYYTSLITCFVLTVIVIIIPHVNLNNILKI